MLSPSSPYMSFSSAVRSRHPLSRASSLLLIFFFFCADFLDWCLDWCLDGCLDWFLGSFDVVNIVEPLRRRWAVMASLLLLL